MITPDPALLWQCFTSGQMSHAQFERHRQDDPGFAEYVTNQQQEAVDCND